jgi:hypothetical protein
MNNNALLTTLGRDAVDAVHGYRLDLAGTVCPPVGGRLDGGPDATDRLLTLLDPDRRLAIWVASRRSDGEE